MINGLKHFREQNLETIAAIGSEPDLSGTFACDCADGTPTVIDQDEGEYIVAWWKLSQKAQARKRTTCRLRFGFDSERLESRELLTTTLPADFSEALFAEGLTSPTSMAQLPDGRWLVTEQAGTLRIVGLDGTVSQTPVIDLSARVDDSGERGLLGVAVHPDFANNHHIYLYYTNTQGATRNRVSRFTMSGDTTTTNTELVLVNLNTLSGTNHNGGAIHFGTDGKLYVAVGDNGTGANSQSQSTLLGKLLRFNDDGSIPSDNPFFNTNTGLNRAIWAIGLRNPYTFAVQPGTGEIYINDVGEADTEEINLGEAGANYGWPDAEGESDDPDFEDPIFSYGHGAGDETGFAITGGVFYNPDFQQFPEAFEGDYFFADFVNNWIRVYDSETDTASGFATGTTSGIVDLDVSSSGSLFYLARGGGGGAGKIFRINYEPQTIAPTVTNDPDSDTKYAGQSVTFSVEATGTTPFTYQWLKDGQPIDGATESTLTITNLTVANHHNALYSVIVTNDFGSDTSAEATLTVLDNTAPVAEITLPTDGATYVAGEEVEFSGTGTDAEDGALAGSAFTWKVDYVVDGTPEPFLPEQTGNTSGSFTPPVTGQNSANAFFRITLKVTDSRGVSHTVTRDVLPEVANITLATNIPDLQVMLDGVNTPTGQQQTIVVGSQHTLSVVSPQTVGNVTYYFTGWSDGGDQTHTITGPEANTTYTANFMAVPEVELPGDEPTDIGKNRPAAVLNAEATVEGGASVDWEDAVLTISTVTNKKKSKDVFSVLTEGTEDGQINVTGTTISIGSKAIATFSYVSQKLRIVFNADAETADVQALYRRIAMTTKGPKGVRAINFQLQLAQTGIPAISNNQMIRVLKIKAQ